MTHVSLSTSITLRRNDRGDDAVTVTPVDYRGRYFNRSLTVEKDPALGPGWFIFAREQFTAQVVKNVARPEGGLSACRNYSMRRFRGWRTAKEAEAWVEILTQYLQQHPPAALYMRDLTLSN